MAEAASPLDGIYFANLAALNFQRENALAQDKRGREQANAQARYAKSELTRQAPLRYAANRNNANSQGLLESGQLAQRQGQTQADYASKQARIAEQRRSAIERFNEGDANAGKGYLVGAQKAEQESFARAKEQLERNPPAGDGAGGAPAAPQPPRVVGIKAQPNSGVRRQAARRASTPRAQAKGWGVG